MKLIQSYSHKKNAMGHSFVQDVDPAEVRGLCGATGVAFKVLLGNKV